mgnify:CR=1 FL=1
MILFLGNFFTKRKIFFGAFIGMSLLQSCATKHAQYGKNHDKEVAIKIADTSTQITDTSKITHTFYLIGDVGNANELEAKKTLDFFENKAWLTFPFQYCIRQLF